MRYQVPSFIESSSTSYTKKSWTIDLFILKYENSCIYNRSMVREKTMHEMNVVNNSYNRYNIDKILE